MSCPKSTTGWTRLGLRSLIGSAEPLTDLPGTYPKKCSASIAVEVGKLDRIGTLSEFAAGQLILGLQSGDPASATVSRPLAGTVEGLLEANGYNTIAPH